ncbi:MAG: hypothetical protein HYX28_10080 [Candidatus Koribacter versatilis]|uniref:Uncharacterized protein n=1 Tax=Candidatus Korobacter versatilis TaxID=658062 RepID=A0A932A9K7_9BACT|nr:hypothetical protein [Candidatus Koribacter versatilis]
MKDAGGLFLLLLAIGVAMALLWFVWSVVLRRYWRVVRMRHARERREMEEAARR